MNIEQLDSLRILISVDDRELFEKFHTSFDLINEGSVQSESFIRSMISTAERNTGIRLAGRSLKIEAARYNNGCIFLITSQTHKGRKLYYIKEKTDTVIFRFDKIDNMFDCISSIYKEGRNTSGSRILRSEMIYYLIIPRLFRSGRIFGIACEYCDAFSFGRLRAAALLERSEVLSEGNAIARIGAMLTAKNTQA